MSKNTAPLPDRDSASKSSAISLALTPSETQLLMAVINANRRNPLAHGLLARIDFLRVVGRRNTGVGLYVDFQTINGVGREFRPDEYILTSVLNPRQDEIVDLILYFQEGQAVCLEAASSTTQFHIEDIVNWINQGLVCPASAMPETFQESASS